MVTNGNLYNILNAVELIQTNLLFKGEIDFESYFKTVGYTAQKINEHEWILTSPNPDDLLMDRAGTNMNFIFSSIFHNYTGRIMDILTNAKLDNPSGYLFSLITCPSFFYKVLIETKDSIRVII